MCLHPGTCICAYSSRARVSIYVLIRASILAEVDAVYALAAAPADCYVGLLLPPNPACQECRAA